jgi:2-keto-4-pentenoate hydratase/2-oxohepta-3-ene-1,7-dioic acid hydratase in catechol pathway
LAAVVGKTASRVSVEDAQRHVLGYTIMFDLSAREIVESEVQMARGKGFDTFAPIADSIVSDIDPDRVALRLSHNGKTVVDTTTADMIFPVAQVVSFISGVMTLYPGDIICTGGAGADRPLLSPGDALVGESPDIGTLAASVIAA